MMHIVRVLLVGDGEVTFLPQLSVSFNHPRLSVGYDWVVKFWDFNLVPSTTEHQIRLQNFVFESSSEAAGLGPFFNHTFDSTSNTRDGL